jgi:hypothetical protein
VHLGMDDDVLVVLVKVRVKVYVENFIKGKWWG